MLLIPSSASSITAFSIDGTAGVIDEAKKIISLNLPYGTDLVLIATFTTTGEYVQVASADTTTADYTVTVATDVIFRNITSHCLANKMFHF